MNFRHVAQFHRYSKVSNQHAASPALAYQRAGRRPCPSDQGSQLYSFTLRRDAPRTEQATSRPSMAPCIGTRDRIAQGQLELFGAQGRRVTATISHFPPGCQPGASTALPVGADHRQAVRGTAVEELRTAEGRVEAVDEARPSAQALL